MNNFDGLYNKDYYGERLYKNHSSDKRLYFRIIENGTILPHKDLRVNGQWTWGFGGIVDSKGDYIKSSFINGGAGAPYTPEEEVIFSPATVIYLGMFFGVWGHCITDSLRRLWFLKSDVFKEYFKNCQLVCICWGGGGILPQFARLLQILEIDLDRLAIITKPIKFQNIILPDESFFGEDDRTVYTKEYLDCIEQVRHFAQKNFAPMNQKKFFYNYGYDMQVGEQRLVQYIQSKGYEIIQPENLPLDEQLNILANCEQFASTEGSCSHNTIFLRDNTDVLLIPRSATRLTEYQLTLNTVHPQNTFYVDSAMSIYADDAHGPFCYLVSDKLRKYFGEESAEKWTVDDYEIFLQYIRFAADRGISLNPEQKKYYESVIYEFIDGIKQHTDLLEKYKVNFE